MNREALKQQIFQKGSYLCVGLDTDVRKLPASVRYEKDPIFAFNRRIIDATAEFCIAYKPNLAFYESLGAAGWESLARTMEYIPKHIFTIADAKRGDIGNTSALYARTFFEQYQFDAVTVAPYMGSDSVQPFLHYTNKWVVLLALTSNQGSADFQQLPIMPEGLPLYRVVMERAMTWASPEQLMFVVGATQAHHLASIRNLAPQHFLLVPGYGAQGGDLHAVSRAGLNSDGGLIVNASRTILYASEGNDFDTAAGRQAQHIAAEMRHYLELYAR
ncbi:MAG: orotidine-5'-phosphate decarboxylase [Cytophagales bacterium]|nr:orotidine-5'-phosphate decarboxylase [Bernardetiaceae bacterium]MDW8205684.1 orotidine-5'-phosphate decarboxylase [Cytophagales bacterium]